MPINTLPRSPLRHAGLLVNIGIRVIELNPFPEVAAIEHAWKRSRLMQIVTCWTAKLDAAIRGSYASEPSLMHQTMMMAAKLYQVVETGFAAVGPVFDVMPVDETRVGTARKAAARVPEAECPANRRRNSSCFAPYR